MKFSKLLFLSFLFVQCENIGSSPNKNILSDTKIDSLNLLKINFITRANWITGSIRNGIRAMEGISFNVNKKDSTQFDYTFSIVNWRDKFTDIKGTAILDTNSIVHNTFMIKNDRDSSVYAIRLYDNSKKYPIWIGISKKLDENIIVRIYEKRPNELKELSYSSLLGK